MLRLTRNARRNYRLSLKYPALVSYNKLPWETLAPESPALHQHVAPLYAHLLRLAAATAVPRLVRSTHPDVRPADRMRVLPGLVYLVAHPLESDLPLPAGFVAHPVHDTVSMQYYGPVVEQASPLWGVANANETNIGEVKLEKVNLLASEDLKLLCLQLTLTFPFSIAPAVPGTALHSLFVPHLTTPPAATSEAARAELKEATLSLFHYFRPHRSPAELTRPLERFLCQHHPQATAHSAVVSSPPRSSWLAALLSSSSASTSPSSSSSLHDVEETLLKDWVPVLQPPDRRANPSKAAPQRATMPAYHPPQSYLMGLAERLAVRPGDCFGRRSLMWGHWF